MTARVGDHRDGAGLVDVIVRTESHTATVGVVRDISISVNPVANLVETVARNDNIAQDARSGLIRSECEYRHRTLANGIITTGKCTCTRERDTLSRK